MRSRSSRAFTLIEVAVSIALSVIVLGTAAALMTTAVADGRRARVKSEMFRDGALVGQLLNMELRQAGLGVPTGGHIENTTGNPDYGTNLAVSPGSSPVRPSRPAVIYGCRTGAAQPGCSGVLVAAPDQLGIVADLPRPDGQYNAYGPLHSRATGATTSIMWHTENNGTCAPDASPVGTSCSVTASSVFFPGQTTDLCDGTGAARFSDRTCPWGMRRVLAGERIQIAAGNGAWSHAALTSPGTIVNNTVITGVYAVSLTPGFDIDTWRNGAPPTADPVSAQGQGPAGINGQGFVTTLDRVFYRRNGTLIERNHCWGDPDPDHVDWPDATAVTVPANPALTPAAGTLVEQNRCTGYEVVARNVVAGPEGFSLSYSDAAGNPIAPPINTQALKASVRRIDYRISFVKIVNERTVEHHVAGSVHLQN